MCKFYNLNVPDRRPGDNPNHSNDDDDDDERPQGHPQDRYVPPHEHKLEYSYWMWFSRRPPARELSSSATGYGQVGRAGHCTLVLITTALQLDFDMKNLFDGFFRPWC